MKTRSQSGKDLIDDLRKAVKKSRFSAINERREKVSARAEAKRAGGKNKKQKKVLKAILNRVVPGDLTVHKISIDQIREEKRKKLRRNMTEYIKPVDSLKLEGNLRENWRKFKRNYDIFAAAIGMDDVNKTDAVKINTFLNAIGPEAVEVFDTLTLTAPERQSYASVTKALADFCGSQQNEVYERWVFYNRNQKEGEPFDSFLMDIKILVKSCEFGDALEVMLRDRIVMGIRDEKLQLKLIKTTGLTYNSAVVECRTAEASQKQQQEMSKTREVNVLKGESTQSSSSSYTQNSKGYKGNSSNSSNNNKHRQNDKRANTWQINTQPRSNTSRNTHNNSNSNNRSQRDNRNSSNQSKCNRCGYCHDFKANCPAQGKTCNVCTKPNHFGRMCKSRNIGTIEYASNAIATNDEFFIGALERSVTGDVFGTRWMERIRINNQTVAFKVDTGAEMNVLPSHVFRGLITGSNVELQRTNMTLRAFGGERIVPEGMCSLLCTYKNIILRVCFAIVDLDVTPILGLSTCARFKIVNPPHTRNNIARMNRYNF